MPWPHPNLSRIPIEVERPITGTMRNLYEWDFEWSWGHSSCETECLEAYMKTDEGEIYVRWDLLDGHWKVSIHDTMCPPWGDFGRENVSPKTTKGVQRWLISRDIPRTRRPR